MSAPSCSIVIRTFNEARHLPQLLSAIAAQDHPASRQEVIVVDSGSTDHTIEIARSFECRIHHIDKSRFSFGRSLNEGCAIATGDVLVCVSGHCVPTDESWLTRLVTPFSRPEVCATYGRQIGGPWTRFSEHQIFSKYFPSNTASQSPYFTNNANAAWRRAAWERFRFDEDLTGLEDMHLGRRLVQAGMRVEYVPDAVVYHHHHETWAQVRRRYFREAVALREVMPELHLHATEAARFFAVAVAGDLARAASKQRFFRSSAEIVFFRLNQYYGAWRGNSLHRRLSRQEKYLYFYPS
jgi:glycosyltransferase involved in cell wall biosynthesis